MNHHHRWNAREGHLLVALGVWTMIMLAIVVAHGGHRAVQTFAIGVCVLAMVHAFLLVRHPLGYALAHPKRQRSLKQALAHHAVELVQDAGIVLAALLVWSIVR